MLRTRRFICLATILAASPASAVVINEIHYHPADGEDNLEFVEVASDSGTPEDLSGYRFIEGIEFEFPAGTILLGNTVLVVAADPDAVKRHYGIDNVLGPFEGRLDNSNDRLTLVNHAGAVLQSVRYQDTGKWPVEADGAGRSLSLRGPYLDSGEPESWMASKERSGTPGRANVPSSEPQYRIEPIIDKGATWRYAAGTGAFSDPETAWQATAFDDSAWLEGPSGFGFADDDDATVFTDMLNGYSTVAVRRRFELTAEQAAHPGGVYLAINYDDGFCAYLNGRKVAHANCSPEGFEPTWNSIATARREATAEEFFLIPADALAAGTNSIAILGLNYRLADNDFTLIPRIVLRSLIESEGEELAPVVFNELRRGTAPGEGWFEIYNPSAAEVDLSGYTLTEDMTRIEPLRLAAGTRVAPRGFHLIAAGSHPFDLTTEKVQLFLLAPSGAAATAMTFDKGLPENPPGGIPAEWSECRFPDGGEDGWISRSPTPGAANAVERVTTIVINEIFYNPPEERRGEFLELFNRGAARVDLSGFQIDRGVDFIFPAGTALEPGAYLVVAEDPAIIKANHGVDALGPYQGQLADDGENVRVQDAWGNLVCEVRYHDGGSWPHWADAGGSSLELIDADQDPSFASAWAASDETAKSEWQTLSFRVDSYMPAASSELHLFLVERGVCRIDSVSITRDGGANLILNGDFEVDTRPWLLQGTHVRSRRITTDAHSGSACLEIDASSKGDTLVNRIEVDTSPAMTRGAYDVSLAARWIHGASVLVAHGEYTAGPYGGRPSPAVNLSGNAMSWPLRLKIPLNLGTPGAENSASIQLRQTTGASNQGPVVAEAAHSPLAPPANTPVVITARVSDSDGVARVIARHALNSARGAFSEVEMFDDGAHQDGLAGDGVFGGELPGFAARAKVVFYIEATDSSGAAGRFPADAPAHTCLFMCLGPVKERVDALRVILDSDRSTELSSRPLHSNDLVAGTLVFNDSEVYYNIGTRYRGSPWGRPARTSYRVRFQDDERFHRGRKSINLSARGASPNEGSVYWICSRNSAPGTPAASQDYQYVRYSFNGGGMITYGLIQPVDRDFLSKWFPGGEDGLLLKCEGRRQMNDAGDLGGNWDGCSYTYRLDNPENYRNYFIPGLRQSIDDWAPFIRLCEVMDRRKTPDAVFDQEITGILDIEQFLRVLAVRIITADWDAFGVGNGHNGVLVFDSLDKHWKLLPFDVDNTFSSSAPALFPTADGEIARLMNRPWIRRLYFQILDEFLAGYWSPTVARPYLTAVQTATGVSTASIITYLNTTTRHIQNSIRTAQTAAFKIVSGDGQSMLVEGSTATIDGDAPLSARSIRWSRDGGDVQEVPLTWTTPSRWRTSLELTGAATVLDFEALDAAGAVIGQVRFTVLSSQFGAVFTRGDSDGNGMLNITDPIVTLRHLFQGGTVDCLDACDADDSGKVDLTDAVVSLDHLFREGLPPPAPFPGLGIDATADELDCGR